jgi:hypothetical protein
MPRLLLALPVLLLLCGCPILVGCAAANVATTPQHNIRLANADLAAALNGIESTALSANQSGTLSTPETIFISQVINNATIASDGIEACVDNSAAGAISRCIAPLIQSIQSKMTISALGIKSTGATATFNVVINGVLTALTKITAAESGL